MKRKILSICIVLFAVYALVACSNGNKYIVTFDSNGGSAVAAVEVKEGSTISQPANPTYADHEFIEWRLNGTKFDFTTAIKSNITLTAYWLGNTEVTELTGFSEERIVQYPQQTYKIARAALRYNCSMEEVLTVLTSLKDPMELLENEKLNEFLNFVLVALESSLEMQLLDKLELPAYSITPYVEQLAGLWEELINQGYETSVTDVSLDDRFVNCIVPVILNTYQKYNLVETNEESVIDVVVKILNVKNRNYQSIERNGESFTFTNVLNNEEYHFTMGEIQTILRVYNQMTTTNIRSAISRINYSYDLKMRQLQYIEVEEIFGEEGLTQEELEEKVEILVSSVKSIIEVKDIISSYPAKFEELANKFTTITNENELEETLEEARKFGIQVIELCEDLLPTEVELDAVNELLQELEYLIAYLGADLNDNLKFLLKEFDNLLPHIYKLVKHEMIVIQKTLGFAKTITTEDLSQIVVFMGDQTNEEALNHINQLVLRLTEELGQSSLEDLFDANELEVISSSFTKAFYNYVEIFLVLTDFEMTEENLTKLEQYLSEFSIYLNSYDITALSELIVELYVTGEITVEFVEEICALTQYLFNGVDFDFAVDFEKEMKNMLYYLIGSESEEIFDIITEDEALSKAFACYFFPCLIIEEFRYEITNVDEVARLNYLYLELYAEAPMADILELVIRLDGEVSTENLLTEEEIMQLYNLVGKAESELSVAELELIEKYEEYIPGWIFPGPQLNNVIIPSGETNIN